MNLVTLAIIVMEMMLSSSFHMNITSKNSVSGNG